MPQRELSLLLQDITDRSQYASDDRTRDAIERNFRDSWRGTFQAIGQDEELSWRITEARKIIALRHLLTHHDYKISRLIVWGILESSLLQLEREVAAMRRASAAFGENE